MSSTNDQDFGAYHPANPADTWRLTRNEHVADVDTSSHDNVSESADTDAIPESLLQDGNWVQSIRGPAWLGHLHNGACETPGGCTHQGMSMDDDFSCPGHLVIKDPLMNCVIVAPIPSWTRTGHSAATMLVETDEPEDPEAEEEPEADGATITVDEHILVISGLRGPFSDVGPDRVYRNGQPQSLTWNPVQIRFQGDSFGRDPLSVDPQIDYRLAELEEMFSTPSFLHAMQIVTVATSTIEYRGG